MSYFSEIITMGDVPRYHALVRPETPAMVFEGRSISYAEFDRRCSQVARALRELGVGDGDRIAFVGKNSPEYFELLFGAAKAGVVMVPISWRLAPLEVDYILKDGQIRALFVDDEFREMVARAPAAASIATVSLAGDGAFSAWCDRQSADDPHYPVTPQHVLVQLYTSGTTGHPKGVQLSHANFYAVEKARFEAGSPDQELFAWNEWGPDDVSILTMPCFHISGTGWGILALYAGAKTVIVREFTPHDVLRAMQAHSVTKLLLVPTAIQMVLDDPDCPRTDFSSLKYLCYGASPIPLEILKRAVKTFACEFVQMYGLTETTGAITFLPPSDHEMGGNERMRSAGRAVFGAKIAVRDTNGQDLPVGESGEICVRPLTLMSGYWTMPEETAKCIDEQGWFRTGDAGYLDPDGYVFIQDRIKDMIVSGAVNIYPAEIENTLYAHPAVAEAAVIGVPDDKWGESIKAFVVLREGTAPDADDIAAFCRERIASYKLPRSFEFVDALPRNASGKVLKTELRRPYWAGRERQVA